MWYFLPTHTLILNFYYFVNCFTFIFIFYYYYIIFLYLYIYIYIFLSPLSSFLFSLSSSFSPLPTLTYSPFLPRHEDMPPSPFFHHFFLFIYLLLTHFPGFPFCPSISSLSQGWQLDNLTRTSIIPISGFLLLNHPPTSIPNRATSFPHFIFSFFFPPPQHTWTTGAHFFSILFSPTARPNAHIPIWLHHHCRWHDVGVPPSPFSPFFFFPFFLFIFFYYFYFIFVSQKPINPHCR